MKLINNILLWVIGLMTTFLACTCTDEDKPTNFDTFDYGFVFDYIKNGESLVWNNTSTFDNQSDMNFIIPHNIKIEVTGGEPITPVHIKGIIVSGKCKLLCSGAIKSDEPCSGTLQLTLNIPDYAGDQTDTLKTEWEFVPPHNFIVSYQNITINNQDIIPEGLKNISNFFEVPSFIINVK